MLINLIKKFIFSGGYLHTFVLNEKLYASIGGSLGVGVDFNTIKAETINGEMTDNDTNYTLIFDGHLGLGYNSERGFSGSYFRLLTATRKELLLLIMIPLEHTSKYLLVIGLEHQNI